MPRCYLLAVSQGSSLDSESNNFTLFGLVERVSLAPGAPLENLVLPFEMHCYWEFAPNEIDVDFEFRIVFTDGDTERATQSYTLRSTKARLRIRLQGMPVLLHGKVVVRTEWRRKGEEKWSRESVFWPLEIERQMVTTTST